MNTVMLVGRLTRDPELRTTPAGVSVVNFGIAVDRRFKDTAGEKQTDFFNVTAWRQTAEFVANYLGKGRLVCVQGSVQNRKYEKDGVEKQVTEIQADQVQGLDRAKEAE